MNTATQPLASSATASQRRWWHLRRWQWVVLMVFALGAVGLAARQPLTREMTRHSLAGITGWTSDFTDAHLSFMPLRYTVTGLSLVPNDSSQPKLFIERLELGFPVGDLMKGERHPSSTLENATLTLTAGPEAVSQATRLLRQAMPITTRRAQLKGGTLVVKYGAQSLQLTHLEATLEANRTVAGFETFTNTLALRGQLGAGTVTVFANAQLRDEKLLALKSQLEVQGLDAQDLDPVLDGSDLQVRGMLGVFADLTVEQGVLTGTLEPTLQQGSVTGFTPQTHTQLRALISSPAVSLQAEQRTANGPLALRGGFTAPPDPDFWNALSTIGKAAFAEGLTAAAQHASRQTH